MGFEKVIRKNPLFEIYIENNYLIVNNADYIKDNCVIKLNDIIVIEVIRSLSLFDKNYRNNAWFLAKFKI